MEVRVRGIATASIIGVLLVGCDEFLETDQGTSTTDETSTEPIDTQTPVDTSTTDSGTTETKTQTPLAEDPYGVVEAHNLVRAGALPTPNPALPDLTWDASLAVIATEYAETCVWRHSGNGYGENLYVSSWESDGTEAVDSWASEVADYDYGTNGCSDVCGHYTQIVWRNTARVGCGFADCGSIEGISFAGRIWVCNYDPPGNFIGQWPY